MLHYVTQIHVKYFVKRKGYGTAVVEEANMYKTRRRTVQNLLGNRRLYVDIF